VKQQQLRRKQGVSFLPAVTPHNYNLHPGYNRHTIQGCQRQREIEIVNEKIISSFRFQEDVSLESYIQYRTGMMSGQETGKKPGSFILYYIPFQYQNSRGNSCVEQYNL